MFDTSVVLQDLHLQRIEAQELAFASSFKLTATRDGVIRCFVLYFDTWFIPDGSDIPPDAEVTVVDPNGTLVPTAEFLQIGVSKASAPLNPAEPPPLQRRPSGKRKPTTVSFSTGPNSFPTHWKQTVFLLKSPFRVIEGNGFILIQFLVPLKQTAYQARQCLGCFTAVKATAILVNLMLRSIIQSLIPGSALLPYPNSLPNHL